MVSDVCGRRYALRILIYAINGKGMGHLNRTTVIARGVRKYDPTVELRFVVASPLLSMVTGAGFDVAKIPDQHHPRGFFAGLSQRPRHFADLFEALLEVYEPDVFVSDFAVNAELFRAVKRRGAQLALVLRRQRPLDLLQLNWRPCVRRVDRFLIPHAASEWPRAQLPRQMRERARYLGPVERRIDAQSVPEVRSRYAQPDQPLIVVTIGGGGYREAYPLLTEAARAAEVLRSKDNLSACWVLVYGPYYRDAIPPSAPLLTRVRYEAHLPELLAAADCVVCNTGYNTLRELQASGTPAVLVPRRDSGRDDQHQRALQYCADHDAVLAEPTAASIASAVSAVVGEGSLSSRPLSADDRSAILGETFLKALAP